MDDFDDIQCEDFYGDDIFDDVEVLAKEDEGFDIDEAVETLYHAIYGAD